MAAVAPGTDSWSGSAAAAAVLYTKTLSHAGNAPAAASSVGVVAAVMSSAECTADSLLLNCVTAGEAVSAADRADADATAV